MRIVVTGSSGRIGRTVCVRLSTHHSVLGVDRVPSSTTDLVGDVGDVALLQRAVNGADAVIHTAALHAPHVPYFSDGDFECVNVVATQKLVETATRAGVRRVVFTSTTAVYAPLQGPVSAARWIDENTLPTPVSIYHRAKLAAEALLCQAAASGGPTIRILRISRCFPEPAPLMAVYRLHRGVDARDVAEAHALALTDNGPSCATYIISGATPFHKSDIPTLMLNAPEVIGRRCPSLADAFRVRGWTLPQSIDRVYDSSQPERTLGWVPRHGFENVLELLDQELAEVLPAGARGTPTDE